MKYQKLSTGIALCSLFFLTSSAQFVTRSTAPLFLTPTELKAWTSNGTTANANNKSTIPLAPRYKILSSQLNPSQSFNMKVDFCNDGIDRWSNYMLEVAKFNTYNFTEWQYIDKFTWFSNNNNGVFLPPRGFIEAAHKNGVKIVGTIMVGNSTSLSQIVSGTTTVNGTSYFTSALKLIEIARYYGFDGYFFNIETGATTAVVNNLILLMRQLQALKDPAMEISWYDAITTSGSLSWQNQLNNANRGFFHNATNGVISNEFFCNYNWGANQVTNSINTAVGLGRSQFDVFMGADCWPSRNAQNPFNNPGFMDLLFTGGNLTSPKTSVAPYAWGNLAFEPVGYSNFINDPTDWASYYAFEARLFAGDDMNSAATNTTGWKGLGYYLPVRTVIGSLPFKTNFNIGQGKIWSVNGVQTTRDWSYAGLQDILPSWQWAITGQASIVPRFDCDLAYNGGSSIKLTGNLNSNSASIKLYQTKLPIAANTKFDLVYKTTAGASNLSLLLYFSDNLTSPVELPVGTAASSDWATKTFDLGAYNGKELNVIGVKVASAGTVANYQSNIGGMNIYNLSALPLRFVSTRVTPIDCANAVEFETANEVNISRFCVERSGNGKDWEVIGTVNAENYNHNRYKLIDPKPLIGRNFYRVKAIEINNVTSYGNVVSTLNSCDAGTFTVYPNPIKDFAVARLISDYHGKWILVKNISGVILTKQAFYANETKLVFNHLPAGVYIIELKDANGRSLAFEKIIKM